MSIDLSKFDPKNASELATAIIQEVENLSGGVVNHISEIEGYLRSLAEAAIQTRNSLKAGRISKDQADTRMLMQEMALKGTVKYSEYIAAALAQKIIDKSFEIVGYAIKNKTGINLFPELISTDGS